MWAAVAAAIAVIGSLGAVWLTHHYNARTEERRLADEAAKRGQDRVESVRARLHQDRVDAYREFISAFRGHSRVSDRTAMAWGTRQQRLVEVDANPSQERHEMFNAANAAFHEVAVNANEASARLGDALEMVELVASEPVKRAASALREKAEQESRARMKTLDAVGRGGDPAEWRVYEDAATQVAMAHLVLQSAVRSELQQDA
jgi:hypothetical protein